MGRTFGTTGHCVSHTSRKEKSGIITSILQLRAAVPIHTWDELTPPCEEQDGLDHQYNARILGKRENIPHSLLNSLFRRCILGIPMLLSQSREIKRGQLGIRCPICVNAACSTGRWRSFPSLLPVNLHGRGASVSLTCAISCPLGAPPGKLDLR